MTKDIFIDTDCISAFLWVRNESLLANLYPKQIIMPKPVYDEIDRPNLAWMKARVDTMIANGQLTVMNIMSDTEEFHLYYKMTTKPDAGHKLIGDGEAASIALAKTKNGIVASNNLRDIKDYIQEYGLAHTTTADILVDALRKGLITETQGNEIWAEMLRKRRRIGPKTFSDYLAAHPV